MSIELYMDNSYGRQEFTMLPAPEPQRSPIRVRQVPAVTRAVAMLRLLSESEQPVGVNAIARSLGLVRSTCLHILRVLVEQKLVAVDARTKRYSLDIGILTFARSALRQNGFNAVVQPELDQLAKRYGMTAIGVQVVDIDHMMMVAHAQAEAARLNLLKDKYELQMIYGIRRDLQQQAHAAGNILQVYVPFGTDWCPYFMRRLSERPANCWFVLRSLLAESGGTRPSSVRVN